MVFYHGTYPDRMKLIAKHGMNVLAKKAHDPGDFGYGLYATTSKFRSRLWGPCIIRLHVDMKKIAHIPNPYRPNISIPVERLFYNLAFEKFPDSDEAAMSTCNMHLPYKHRIKKSIEIRRQMMIHGYHGIYADNIGSSPEIVLFSLVPIIHWFQVGRC